MLSNKPPGGFSLFLSCICCIYRNTHKGTEVCVLYCVTSKHCLALKLRLRSLLYIYKYANKNKTACDQLSGIKMSVGQVSSNLHHQKRAFCLLSPPHRQNTSIKIVFPSPVCELIPSWHISDLQKTGCFSAPTAWISINLFSNCSSMITFISQARQAAVVNSINGI